MFMLSTMHDKRSNAFAINAHHPSDSALYLGRTEAGANEMDQYLERKTS